MKRRKRKSYCFQWKLATSKQKRFFLHFYLTGDRYKLDNKQIAQLSPRTQRSMCVFSFYTQFYIVNGSNREHWNNHSILLIKYACSSHWDCFLINRIYTVVYIPIYNIIWINCFLCCVAHVDHWDWCEYGALGEIGIFFLFFLPLLPRRKRKYRKKMYKHP